MPEEGKGFTASLDSPTPELRLAGERGLVRAEAAILPPETVPGVTIMRAVAAHALDRQTQKSRSLQCSFGRVTVRLYTGSWCRKARFSRASRRWPPQKKGRRRSRWSRRVIMKHGYCPDRS